MHMIARVDGSVVERDAVWAPEMNFGIFNVDATLGTYELEFRLSEFLDVLEEPYSRCVAELKADFEMLPDQEPDALHAAGYPPITELLNHPEAAQDVVEWFLAQDLFTAAFPRLPSPAARFMINSIDAVSADGPVVVVRGRGYHGAPGFARTDR